MTKDYFAWLKEIFVYFFSRYGYVLWVQISFMAIGASSVVSFLLTIPLIALIAWRDSQFIDEDGYNMVFSLESKIRDKVSKIWKRFYLMMSQFSDDCKAQRQYRENRK